MSNRIDDHYVKQLILSYRRKFQPSCAKLKISYKAKNSNQSKCYGVFLCSTIRIFLKPKHFSYQQVARQYSIESIGEFKEKLEEIAEKQRDQQADMEKALEMLFGKPKANNKEEEKGLSASVSKNNSKINLHGSRKRSSTGVVLESAKSNVSVELKISDSAKNLATKKASQKLEAQSGEEEEEEAVEIPEIETNEPVLNLFAELKPLILQLSDTCVNLRNWIVLLIPKAEDGNNFGVEVQEQCLVKLIGEWIITIT